MLKSDRSVFDECHLLKEKMEIEIKKVDFRKISRRHKKACKNYPDTVSSADFPGSQHANS